VATLKISLSPKTKGMFLIPSISMLVTPEIADLTFSLF